MNMKKVDSEISSEEAMHHLYQMLLIRKFEEKSAEEYSKSKIRGFLHLYVGEEAVAVGLMANLKKEDYVLATYREHGHALARGMDPGSLMAEMFGKQEGCCKGRGGSMHLFDKNLNFYGGNAIVGGHLPLSVGMALASKRLEEKRITCCFFGEGAAAEGEFHETMNLAALWEVPLLLVCENNLYAMGTALRYTHAGAALEKKAEAYGIAYAAVDGMDLLAVLDAAAKAVNYIQETGKPFFLVCNTYRFRAHSMFDAELYREKAEVEEWKKKDPIPRLKAWMKKKQWLTEDLFDNLSSKVDQEVRKAVEFADQGTWESVEALSKHVYSEGYGG